MQFDLVSDFHTEMNHKVKLGGVMVGHYDWEKEKQSDILVVAGDSGNTIYNTIEVIDEAREFYDHVIFTDGNHEHYQGTQPVLANMADLQAYANVTENVTYLGGKSKFVSEDTAFIGANGWYDWKYGLGDKETQRYAWMIYSNDSRCIMHSMDPDKMAKEQAKQVGDMVMELQDDDSVKKIVIVTHTVPVKDGVVSNTRDIIWEQLNGSYGNSYMRQVFPLDRNEKVKTWVFGHTHFNKDFVEEHIRFISNPRGYNGESRDGEFYKGLKQVIV